MPTILSDAGTGVGFGAGAPAAGVGAGGVGAGGTWPGAAHENPSRTRHAQSARRCPRPLVVPPSLRCRKLSPYLYGQGVYSRGEAISYRLSGLGRGEERVGAGESEGGQRAAIPS